MNPLEIIDKYCKEEELRHILLVHSRAVADKALAIARNQSCRLMSSSSRRLRFCTISVLSE